MRAICYSRYGPPDVLRVEELPEPVPREGEVLVRVRAAEATKADCELRAFRFAVNWFWLPLRLAVGVWKPRRRVLGTYFAGEVVALGAGATGFSVGDAVFGSAGLRMGAYGEFVALPAKATLAAKPAGMSFVEAAAVPLGGLNALHFMRLARIASGESVLVNGAGGSIGAHAVQIAKAMGAEVTGVDHGAKVELVRRLGADHFVDYTRADFTALGSGFDVVFDMVPTSDYAACIRVLRPGGRYLCGNPRFSVMLRSLLTTRFTDKTASVAFAGETREELSALRAMVDSGQIRSIVDRVFTMDGAAEAHRLVESERRQGAIVIEMR